MNLPELTPNTLTELPAEQPAVYPGELYPGSADIAKPLGAVALLDTAAIEREDPENERKEIVGKNTKRLKKRFGEIFVKGERLESGEYAGSGARELLSKFMETPGFADEVTRTIPNKHQALKTLRDNQDYILAIFEQHYKQMSLEEQEPIKDPYELAKQAGYELAGPFEDVAEFTHYKEDYRPGEQICTFNEPEARLSAYHILWLRAPDADTIVPADELTPDNMTQSWEDYLRTIGRYDSQTDTYNLDGLNPARGDPYGVSSMSVQISRCGNHVSVKNRYNHTVTNPDNTYDNNLDNVAYGLRKAIYHQVGREDLMSQTNTRLNHNYVLDNNEGVHPYYYEKDNIYFGHYEYIENGQVKTIDKGAYAMLSPELYVGKLNNGDKTISTSGESMNTSFEQLEEGTYNLHIYSSDDESDNHEPKLQQTYNYSYDEHGQIQNVKLRIAEGAETGDIRANPALTALTVAEGARTGEIWLNPALTALTVAEGTRTGGILFNPALTALTVAEGSRTGYIRENPALTALTVAEGAENGGVWLNSALTALTVAEGARTGGILFNPALTALTVAEGARTRYIRGNPALTALTVAEGAETGDIHANPALTEFTVAEGARTGDVFNNNPQLVINRA